VRMVLHRLARASLRLCSVGQSRLLGTNAWKARDYA
jgi:hypothetical protein